jgi:hypothetical protein
MSKMCSINMKYIGRTCATLLTLKDEVAVGCRKHPEGKSIGDKRHRKQNRGGIRTYDLLLRRETRYPLRHTDTDKRQ